MAENFAVKDRQNSKHAELLDCGLIGYRDWHAALGCRLAYAWGRAAAEWLGKVGTAYRQK
jgi:hypothetical protein